MSEFKVGDEVRVVNTWSSFWHSTAVVVSVDPDLKYGVRVKMDASPDIVSYGDDSLEAR